MKRQKAIRDILLIMEDFGRIMIIKKFEHIQPGMPTNSQMDVLLIIDFNGPQSVKSLAEKLRMTPSGVSQLVNLLVKAGFLTRKEDEVDRRVIRLELTDKANRLLSNIKKMRMKQGEFFFAGLNDNELAQLERIQRKMLEYLHKSISNKH